MWAAAAFPSVTTGRSAPRRREYRCRLSIQQSAISNSSIHALRTAMKDIRKLMKRLVVPQGKRIRLTKYDPAWTGSMEQARAKELLANGVQRLAKQQALLYAQDTYSVLLIFQAMDAAGKDGAIKHVLSGVNPQGCQVFSFKAPSAEEQDHTYLWRSMKALPERGRIGIHNRSYYEEVLIARVHKEVLAAQQVPEKLKKGNIWKRRYREINDFEQHL